MTTESRPPTRAVACWFFAGIAALYLVPLAAVGIFDPEEGRHVSVATAMLRTGDLVVPQLQGFPYLEKPPLAYWLITAAFRALGRTTFASRLPVALMGLSVIAAVFVVARAVLGTRAALLSAGVLALSTQWFVQARYATTDMIVSAWIAVALCAFYFGFHARRRGAYVLFFLGMAMAALAKGIIGVLLPCGVVAVFVAWTRRWKLILDMRPVSGAALLLAIVLPWFILVERRIPEFLHYFVVDQHIARFLGTADEHPAPMWFFLPVLAFGFFPWIVHLKAAAPRVRPQSDLQAFLWSWFSVIFVFFSLAQEKLMGYILPAYPPLAILVGGYLARLWEPAHAADTVRRVCRSALVSGACLLAMSPIFVIELGRFMQHDGRLSMAEIGPWPWVLAATYATGGAAQIVLAWRRRAGAALAAAALCQALAFLVFVGGAAAADDPLGTRSIGTSLSRLAAPEDAIVLYRVQQPSVEYYTGRPPTLFGWTGEYAWGMKVRPDRSLATDDIAELRSLLLSSKRVWLVTSAQDRTAARDLGVPLLLVTGNRKRTIYRNHAEEVR